MLSFNGVVAEKKKRLRTSKAVKTEAHSIRHARPWQGTVLDPPLLYSHPPAQSLLDLLEELTIGLEGFDGIKRNEDHDDSLAMIGGEEGVPRYLTDIISSRLSWIEDEQIRVQIWEAASARLSERSGRTAMPSTSRTFQIPSTVSAGCPEIPITLAEPSLTGDNLGHKTWAASYLLAKRLPCLFSFLPRLSTPDCSSSSSPSPLQVLELGAGTGLVGIAFAALFPVHVSLTDLPSICSNLTANLSTNLSLISSRGSSARAFSLDWTHLPPHDTLSEADKYDVIIAADSLYSSEHPRLLVDTIGTYLKSGGDARVVVELPLREAYAGEMEEMKGRMKEKGLRIVEQGEETGWDDWGRKGGKGEVRCWWGVWAREMGPSS